MPRAKGESRLTAEIHDIRPAACVKGDRAVDAGVYDIVAGGRGLLNQSRPDILHRNLDAFVKMEGFNRAIGGGQICAAKNDQAVVMAFESDDQVVLFRGEPNVHRPKTRPETDHICAAGIGDRIVAKA